MEDTMSGVVCLLVFTAAAASAGADQLSSAPVGGALGERPFTAIWNGPSEHCMGKFGVDLNLTGYDIVNESVIFYNDHMGLYPFIKDGVTYNGGVPQVVNLTSHLEKATEDIIRYIPDVDYSGIAVIDWEYWQPIWEANDGRPTEVYKAISISMVQSRHPDWDSTLVEEVARLEFEQAAEALFLSTVRLANLLRPSALWGFYHFPYCFYNASTGNCSKVGLQSGDRMYWLYDETSALYPSIYLNTKDGRIQHPISFVASVILEAYRVRQDSSRPVLTYFRYKYAKTELFLNLEHLQDTVLLSAEMGASGIVVWVADSDSSSKDRCQELGSYIKAALGPLIKATIDAASRCSESLCSGHGRCIGKIMTCTQRAPSSVDKIQHTLNQDSFDNSVDSGRRAHLKLYHRQRMTNVVKSLMIPSEYGPETGDTCTCQCYEGWSGHSCNLSL